MRRPSKFHNKPVVKDGIRFASQKEGRRYDELRLLERGGAIRDLRLQVRYPLKVNGLLVCTYVPDFVYHDITADREIVEDAKGVRTREFITKSKLFEAIHGFKVVEV